MFSFLHRHRVHEPIAVGALLAAGAALHTAWILNLLRFKITSLDTTLTLWPRIGSISGLYVITAATYALTFGVVVLWLRGKDCSGARDRAFWFFVAGIVAYLIMTVPFIYGFEIVGPT